MKLFDIQIEQACLGCAILEPEKFEILRMYDENYFYATANKRFFNFLKKMYEQYPVFDETIFLSKVNENSDLRVVYSDCVTSVIICDNFDHYLKELAEYKIKRDIKALSIFTDKLGDADNLSETIGILSKKIEDLHLVENADERKKFDDIIDEYNELRNRGDEMNTGFPLLDRCTGGLRRKKVYVLGGLPGSGKTTLATYLSQRIAFIKNKKVLIFSLEMSMMEIVGKLTSILFEVPSWKIHQPWLCNDEDLNCITKTCCKLYKSNLEIVEGVWSIGRIIQKIKQSKPDFVIIDHLQFIPLTIEKYGKEHEAIGNVIKNLKNIAKVENVCIMAISHNRRGAAGSHQNDNNSDYKGSAAIKEISDVCMMLVRPNKEKKGFGADPKPDNFIELKIIKNRNTGMMNTVPLVFNPLNLHFMEYAEQPEGRFL